MTATSPNILLIEDNPGDARYIRELFEEARDRSDHALDRHQRVFSTPSNDSSRGGSLFHHVTRLEDAVHWLETEDPDVVLLDLNLPDSTGIETLTTLVGAEPTIPIVVLTGLRDRELGIEALRNGAEEYLVKDEIVPDLLIRSVYHAVERKTHEREQLRYETLVEKSTDTSAIIDPDGTIEYLTPSVEHALGYTAEELVGEDCFEYIHPEDRDDARDEFSIMLAEPDYQGSFEFRFLHANGSWIVLHGRGRNLLDEPAIGGLVVSTHDITERKEDEQQLERQRARLAAINQLNDVVNRVTEAVIDQSTRDEIEQIACDELASSDSYEFAWIGESDPTTRTVASRASAGTNGYLERVDISTIPDDQRRNDATALALDTGEMQVISDVHQDERSEPWRTIATEYGFKSWAAIPIRHEESTYGVLNVYADRPQAFREEERAVIDHLGEIVGHAIAAADRKQALMSESVTELEFRIPDIFNSIGVETTPDSRITIAQTITVSDSEFLIYGSASADAIASLERMCEDVPHWESVTIVNGGIEEPRFELQASKPPVMSEIASLGGSVTELIIDAREVQLTVQLPQDVAVRTVIETVQERYPTAEPIARRQVSRGSSASQKLQRAWRTELTDRQRTVIETAYFTGYFEWPRENSGKEVADSLDIASATFSQHLRVAQNKVFGGLLENGTGETEPDSQVE